MMKGILRLGNVSIPVFILMLLLLISFYLLGITRKQIRIPLIFNYAISGVGRRITIEKVHAKCPQCGGKMKYCYKKAGANRITVLQCTRNENHWYEVDPAEDKLK